ncbi:glycosyltransferase [Iningainema tapete]|uniref:Glycosyltransferase family 2 protein n=1 Tax=Iningainema tapete BLCC-T55 TaxID=2748662 RepID=A0A8J6XCS7_9CYAN|nr:glycosyltransferase family 2 protein [Iningainema tapete]MBD2770738.1 glycosyltransferase family 2 protein [Iningainema tapete BLCC-T55]
MKDLAIFLSKILLGWWGDQVIISLLFLLYLRFYRKKSLPDDLLPKTAVILYIRGADPYLSNCLQALLNQNYLQYDLKLIVDSEEDPAWNIITDIIRKNGATNLHVSLLQTPNPNCSLKCHALIQAISELDDSYKVVALLDADTVVHPNWLRELVTPLANPKVGATTGNHWYVPGRYWGSLVRYMCNISTVVQMHFFRIAWGGTLALKTEVIHQTGLLDKWGQAYGEDMMISRILAKHSQRVVFVPSLIILNREECTLQSIYHWFKRQLLSSRLYHPHWWGIIVDAILSVLLPNVILVLLILALLTGQWDAATVFFDSLGGYTLAALLLACALEKGVQPILRNHDQRLTKLSVPTLLKMFIGIPLSQWVYGLAMISSLTMTKVNWRGVTYQIKSPWNIRLLDYRPYRLSAQPDDPKVSL